MVEALQDGRGVNCRYGILQAYKRPPRSCKLPEVVAYHERTVTSMIKYTQDSLPLRVDDEHIPSFVPTLDTTPQRRRSYTRLQDARSHGVPEQKRCRVCREVKPSAEFSFHPKSRDNLQWACRDCARILARVYASKDKAKHRARERYILKTYGLTLDQFDAMLDQQGGVCAICCGGPSTTKGWHVDHDHDTGEVRGILCQGCNIALGGMRDRPDLLRAAADYLELHGK